MAESRAKSKRMFGIMKVGQITERVENGMAEKMGVKNVSWWSS